jgi:phenylacetic acid degradation operon negative regulatory protein
VVARAWDLKELEGRSAAFLRRTGEMLDEAGTFGDRQAFRSRFLVTHQFRHFLFGDPDLPDALLPRGWVGGAARDAFFEYNRKLKRRAERYYLSLAEDGTIVENIDRKMGAHGDR